MRRIGEETHEIYKERGSMNRAIGLVLGAFVIIVALATMAKFTERSEAVSDSAAVTSDS